MSIFGYRDGKLDIEPANLTIPEFRYIFERDITENKATAFKELLYIYHMSDYKSPYNNLDEDEREKTIISDFFPEGLNVDSYIKAAILKYQTLNTTPTMRLLQDSRKSLEKIRKYFNNVDLTELDDKGRRVHSLSEVTSSLANLGKIVDSFDKLEEKIKKEISITSKIRGDKEISDFERDNG